MTADGGKTKTFLFSIEAASPSDTKGAIEDVANQTESFVGLSGVSPTSKRSKFQETGGPPSSIEWSSSRDTDHSSVFGITSAKIGLDGQILSLYHKGNVEFEDLKGL